MLAFERGCQFFETSAKTANNVQAVFQERVQERTKTTDKAAVVSGSEYLNYKITVVVCSI